MIRAKKNPLLPIYKFHDENGELGTLNVSLIKPNARFSGKEGDFTFFREKPFEGTYFLSSAGYSYLAQARKPNGIGLKYEVQFGQKEYNLEPGELFYDRMHLHYEMYKGDELIGTLLRGTSLFEYLVDIGNDFPPVFKIFVFWLSLRAWMGQRGWSLAKFYR